MSKTNHTYAMWAAFKKINWFPVLIIPLTVAVAFFLWWPPLALYGTALSQTFLHTPHELIASLPVRPYERSLFINTIVLAVLTALFTTVFGLPVAITMARGRRRVRSLVTVFTALPLALPPILIAMTWLVLTRAPAARSLASLAADKPMPIGPVHLAALVLALCYFPIVAFAGNAALRAIPGEMEESALLFEDSMGVWRRITGPLLAPALLGAAGIAAAFSMWEMGAPDLLDARTYSVQIYRNLNAPNDLDPQGTAIRALLSGLPLIVLGILMLWPALRALRFYEHRMPRAAHWDMGNLAGGRGAITYVALLILAASPFSPIITYLSQLHPLGIVSEEWGANDVEIYNTILLATMATAVILLLGFIIVTALRWWPIRLQRSALVALVAPVLIPPIMLGVVIINFWNQDRFAAIYDDRYAIMIVGYLARFLPLVILLMYEASRRVHEEQLEAAANLGAAPGRIVRTVLAPLMRPALFGLAALSWASCAGELSTSVLINPPGGQTLPVPIFNAMHIGYIEKVAALSVILVGLTVAFGLAMLVLAKVTNRYGLGID